MKIKTEIDVNPKALLRKLDLRIIPLLIVVFTFCFLDRVNIGHARLYGIEYDLSLTPNEYAWCLSIFFLGYIIFEIPSNMMMLRVEPNKWLGFLMSLWGIVGICMAATTNFGGLFAARFFLGVLEAGFLPGIVLFISAWYSRQEQCFRLSCISSSSQLAGVLGGIISFMIHFVAGTWNLTGWQWLFIIEGILTVVMGILIWVFLPSKPQTTEWLSDSEKSFLSTKLSNHTIDISNHRIDKSVFLEIFTDFKIYLYAIISLGIGIPCYSVSLLMPTIIKEMGFTNLNAMLLTSPPSAVAYFLILVMSYYSDKFLKRSFFVIIGVLMALLGFSAFLFSTSIYLKYAALFIILPGVFGGVPSVLAWTNNNYMGSKKSAIVSAFMLSIGNLSGIIGGQMFRPEEAPHYFVSNLINIVVLAATLPLIFLLRHLIRRENTRLDLEKLTLEYKGEFRHIL